MRKLILGLALAMPFATHASCSCMCINGQVRAVCEKAKEIRPKCSPDTCPVVPPLSIAPVRSPKAASSSATNCQQVHVYDYSTKQYSRRMVCS
jgi:hypothetical protein